MGRPPPGADDSTGGHDDRGQDRDEAFLEAQEHKGFGDDEGEREESLDDRGAGESDADDEAAGPG